MGFQSYLELGTFDNSTISGVECAKRYGVDLKPQPCPGVTMFAMSTAEFIENEAKKYAPYDCVFIDANHSAQSVREDFGGILPYVSPEGLILLHDSNPETEADCQPGYCGDAWRFVRSLTVDFECVTLPFHPGITIVRNRQKWGPEK
jgi:predicted O-methyltransferase YrrM